MVKIEVHVPEDLMRLQPEAARRFAERKAREGVDFAIADRQLYIGEGHVPSTAPATVDA